MSALTPRGAIESAMEQVARNIEFYEEKLRQAEACRDSVERSRQNYLKELDEEKARFKQLEKARDLFPIPVVI